jgi:tight adherence protein B
MMLLLYAGIFFGMVLLIVGGWTFINRDKLAAAESARAQLQGGIETVDAIEILRDERLSDIPFLNRLLAGRAIGDRLHVQLLRAGSNRKPGEVLLACLAGAVLGLLVGQRWGPIGALLLAAAGGGLPLFLLRRAQWKRQAAYEVQLPEALDMLVNALRSGYSLQAAMEFTGKEIPAPLGPEFGRFYDEQRLGMEVRMALLRFQERIGTVDARMFITSLLIQRETGGNLGEVLTKLADLMRDRVAFRGQVRTLTAEPKMSARVLACLPLAVFLIINLINPDFMEPLLTTETGHFIIAYAGISVLLGYMVMAKIADIDI